MLRERTFDTLQPLVDLVFELVPQVRHFYSDGLSAYGELVYVRDVVLHCTTR